MFRKTSDVSSINLNPKLFKLSSHGKISIRPQKAFQDSLNRTEDELRIFDTSHKFIVFTKSTSGSTQDIINELNLEQVESGKLERLIPHQWTTIPGKNCVVFATFHPTFLEDRCQKPA